jgi:hypothetical protein
MDTLTRKRQVTADFGLPTEMAEMLKGETEAEIKDSASRLVEGLKNAKNAATASATSAQPVRSFGVSGEAEKPW